MVLQTGMAIPAVVVRYDRVMLLAKEFLHS
ncbi:hypothetical protein MAUB1S_11562 [Mycolicibacterium aubagnense]